MNRDVLPVGFLGKKPVDAILGTPDDRLAALYQNRALQELFVLEENLNHRLRVLHIVSGIELKLLEF